MNDTDLLGANERLAVPPEIDFALSRRLGFFVVGRLAKRHGIRVQLRHSWYGGVTALVLIPESLFLPGTIATPVGAVASRRGAAAAPELHGRAGGPDYDNGLGDGDGAFRPGAPAPLPAAGFQPQPDGPPPNGGFQPLPNGGGHAPNGGFQPLPNGGGFQPVGGFQRAGDQTPVPAERPAFTPRISNAARLPRGAAPPPAGNSGNSGNSGPPPRGGGRGRQQRQQRQDRQHQQHQQPGEQRQDPLADYHAGLVQGRLAANLEAPPPLSPPISQFRRDEQT